MTDSLLLAAAILALTVFAVAVAGLALDWTINRIRHWYLTRKYIKAMRGCLPRSYNPNVSALLRPTPRQEQRRGMR